MKKYFILSILCFSCSNINLKNTNINCNENTSFKVEFFKNVKNVEDFIVMESTTHFEDFEEYEKLITEEKIYTYKLSLKFISKYAHVSYESMLNYATAYPLEVYEKDKQGWLKWYEENKCSNIQFKE
jgi:hypothetical protein